MKQKLIKLDQITGAQMRTAETDNDGLDIKQKEEAKLLNEGEK